MRDDVDAMVGRRLRARRRLMDLSQRDLAEVCGVTFQQIHKYESAVCRMPVATLWRLAHVLDVDISYFFDGLLEEVPANDERRTLAMAPVAMVAP